MSIGTFNTPSSVAGAVYAGKKDPRHIVVLSEDGRTDASLTSNAKLADLLEKRATIPVSNAKQGPCDGSRPLAPTPSVSGVDPYDLTVAMAAIDGEPVVSGPDRDAWGRFRVKYDVVLDAPPFKVTGTLMLLPNVDPTTLTGRGTELFLPVFDPSIEAGGARVRDVVGDVVLINRSHLRRVEIKGKR